MFLFNYEADANPSVRFVVILVKITSQWHHFPFGCCHAVTGRRPDTTRSYDLDQYWRDIAGNFSTIPQYFKENGYTSIGVGKIFHSGAVHGRDDRDYSWSETPFRESGDDKWEGKEFSWQIADPEFDESIPQRDTIIKDYAIEKLNELAPAAISGEQPFFLAVGFQRPHLPHVAPKQFYDLYNTSDITVASNPHVPEGLSNLAYSKWGELRAYEDVAALNIPNDFNTTLPDYFAIDLRLAYYATVSFVDSLFGELLAELETLGLDDNTVVILFSDNGLQLGEHSEWAKHTNFEIATQVPLMLRVPGTTDAGLMSSAFVELVDIFPTLSEATGLHDVTPVPRCPLDSANVLLCHEGYSFMPLAEGQTEEWKSAAFYQYPRNSDTRMGYVIRTEAYQYVRWVEFRHVPVSLYLHTSYGCSTILKPYCIYQNTSI